MEGKNDTTNEGESHPVEGASTDLMEFFTQNNLSNQLLSTLTGLGVVSLAKLLRMDESQILLFGQLPGFDASLSSDLIILIGCLKTYKEKYEQETDLSPLKNTQVHDNNSKIILSTPSDDKPSAPTIPTAPAPLNENNFDNASYIPDIFMNNNNGGSNDSNNNDIVLSTDDGLGIEKEKNYNYDKEDPEWVTNNELNFNIMYAILKRDLFEKNNFNFCFCWSFGWTAGFSTIMSCLYLNDVITIVLVVITVILVGIFSTALYFYYKFQFKFKLQNKNQCVAFLESLLSAVGWMLFVGIYATPMIIFFIILSCPFAWLLVEMEMIGRKQNNMIFEMREAGDSNDFKVDYKDKINNTSHIHLMRAIIYNKDWKFGYYWLPMCAFTLIALIVFNFSGIKDSNIISYGCVATFCIDYTYVVILYIMACKVSFAQGMVLGIPSLGVMLVYGVIALPGSIFVGIAVLTDRSNQQSFDTRTD